MAAADGLQHIVHLPHVQYDMLQHTYNERQQAQPTVYNVHI